MTKAPPDTEVLRPATTVAIPPAPLVPLPTLTVTAPPRPAVATPDATNTPPLFPDTADPELNTRHPLTPESPLFADITHTLPLDVAVPSPLVMRKTPPLADVDRPD